MAGLGNVVVVVAVAALFVCRVVVVVACLLS